MDLSRMLDDLSGAVSRLGEGAAALVPKLVGAFALVLGGWLLALLVRLIVRRVVARADRLVPGARARDALREAVERNRIDVVVARIAYWIVWLVFIVAATETLGLPVVTTWLGDVAAYVPHLLIAALIGTVGVVGARLGRRTVTSALQSTGLEHSDAVGRIVQIAVLVATFLVVIGQIGVKVAFLTATVNVLLAIVLGSAGLAFGLGARSIVANILAAHYVQRLYEIGQRVRIGDAEGRIVRVLPTAIILDCADGEVAIPPDEFTRMRSTRVAEGG